jgi:hypothetical protein
MRLPCNQEPRLSTTSVSFRPSSRRTAWTTSWPSRATMNPQPARHSAADEVAAASPNKGRQRPRQPDNRATPQRRAAARSRTDTHMLRCVARSAAPCDYHVCHTRPSSVDRTRPRRRKQLRVKELPEITKRAHRERGRSGPVPRSAPDAATTPHLRLGL